MLHWAPCQSQLRLTYPLVLPEFSLPWEAPVQSLPQGVA